MSADPVPVMSDVSKTQNSSSALGADHARASYGGGLTLETLASQPYWVAWQVEDRGDGSPPTKIPYGPLGRKARAGIPETWGTLAEAEAIFAKLDLPYELGGVGIEFTSMPDGLSTGGIDLDSCRHPETGVLAGWAEEILAAFDTYAEVSPSKTGCKLFFTYVTADLPILREAMGSTSAAKSRFGRVWKWQARAAGGHPPAIELHLGHRYFAVTREQLPHATAELRPVSTANLLQLIRDNGPAFVAADPLATAEMREPTVAPASAKKASAPADRSRSGIAFRKGKQLVRDGASFEQMREVLRADPETSAWMREKGDKNGGREARRIFEAFDDKRPLIQLRGGQIHNEATSGESAILEAHIPIFQRGNGLVRPAVQMVPASRGRTTHSACLVEVTAHGLIDNLCAVAAWKRFDARSRKWNEVNPPMAVAQTILSRAGKWRFSRISGVTTTPTLRPDGSILVAAGYDAATRLYHMPDPDCRLHSEVFTPTRLNAENALKLLEKLLPDFPFIGVASKAVALSGLITPVVRAALSVAPLHALKAHSSGTGKSFLMDLISAITTGRPCPVISAASDEQETEKRIAGLLLAASPICSLDNVNGELGGDLLCQAIERPLIRIRRLGGSDIIEIENKTSLFATGNNLRVRGDMVRRTLVGSLDAGVERPELREFAGDPVATVMADRGVYVSACLIIVRAYAAAGRPGLLKPIASFQDWSDIVRSALVWLGCDDPAQSMEEAREDDPELTELREVIGLWYNAFGEKGHTAREVATSINIRNNTTCGEPTDYTHPDLREALLRMFGERGELNTRRFGKWLLTGEGRIVGNLRIKRESSADRSGAQRWIVGPPSRSKHV